MLALSILLTLLAAAIHSYSQYALFLIRRWLTLPYYLYCLRLAALYEK